MLMMEKISKAKYEYTDIPMGEINMQILTSKIHFLWMQNILMQ